MNRVAGLFSAEALVRVGLPHDIVVWALVREIGLSPAQAEVAWREVCPAHDGLPAIRRELRNIVGHDSA